MLPEQKLWLSLFLPVYGGFFLFCVVVYTEFHTGFFSGGGTKELSEMIGVQ